MHANLAELRANPHADSGLIAKGQAQIGTLAVLARQIDTASPVALAMLRAAVAASVVASSTLAQQASAATATAQSAEGTALAAASAEARSTVSAFERDMYERKIFDPYLHFASKEDEEAYRRREAQRQAETKKAEAEQTPQGDLRALKLSMEQLKDAGAHGATASPDYAPRLHLLESKEAGLAAALGAPSSQSASVDPLDKAAPGNVDPAILAAFKSHGVVMADPSGQGHGVSPTTSGVAAVQAR